MKNAIYIFLIFVTHLSFSQIITLPHQDSIITYQVIIRSIGDSTKHTETAYFKSDTSKIAWIKYFVDTNVVGVYREYFPNGNTYKKVFFDHNGKRNGIYQEWDENEQLTVSGKYRNDKKQGLWIYFKEKRNEVYKKGIKQGRWRIYEGKEPWSLYVYKKGKLVKVNKDQKPLIAR